MTTLDDLISRLEKATEGSRELNNLIAPIAGWHRVEPRYAGNKHGAWIAPQDWIGTMSDGSPILDGMHGTTLYREAPDFTRSLDAAMSLVPEGRSVIVSDGIWSGGRAYAIVHPPQDTTKATCHATTMPLALCIAALKARSHDVR